MDEYVKMEHARGARYARLFRKLVKDKTSCDDALHEASIIWANETSEFCEGFVSAMKPNEIVWFINHIK